MRRLWAAILALCVAAVVALPVVAADNSKLQIMIFPVECSIDVLQIGNGSLTQVTPENCLDKPEPPPSEPQPNTPAPDDTSPTDETGGVSLEELLRDNPSTSLDELLTPPVLPIQTGYDSVVIHDVPVNKEGAGRTAAEISLYLAIIVAIGALFVGYYAVHLVMKNWFFVPIIFHRFRRPKK